MSSSTEPKSTTSIVIIKNNHGWIAYVRGTDHDCDIFNANKNKLYSKVEEVLSGKA